MMPIKALLAIARVTFFEIIRDKVLYNILLCSLILLGLGWLASRLSIIRPERVILDFGLSAMTLSGAALAMLTGGGLLGKELERRTIQVVLSRPLSRAHFMIGKFFGLAAVIFLNWLILSAVYLALLYAATPGTPGAGLVPFSSTLGIAIFLSLLQSLVLGSFSILLSTVTTASLTVIFNIGFYLVGNTLSQLKIAILKLESVWIRKTAELLVSFLPNFESFNLGTQVTYGLPVSLKFVIVSVVYGILMMVFCLLGASALIRIREV